MEVFSLRPDLKNKRIAVLAGGCSGERDVSLRSGKKVFESLKKQGYNVILLDSCLPNKQPDPDLTGRLQNEKVDLVFNLLHGRFGEDGVIQGLLEHAGIPYTGSGVLASALAMNKVASKKIFDTHNLPSPKQFHIDPNQNLPPQTEEILKTLGLPVVIKPASEGSSLGVSIIKDQRDLLPALEKTQKEFKDILAEEFIAGTEVTVGILGVNSQTKALPILELIPKSEFYNYEAKYTPGKTEFILPARLPKDVYTKTQETALLAHKYLGCRGWSRVDIIVNKDGTPYVHDVNTIPGMTDQSDLPAEAAEAGISYDELVVRILESAIQ